MKTKLSLIFKFLALVVIYFVAFALISALVLPQLPETTPAKEPLSAFSGLLIMSFLNTAVMTYVTRRSEWFGVKLILALAAVLFGVTTVMPQVETAVFVRTLPAGFLSRLFLVGFLFSAVFSTALVLFLSNPKRPDPIGIERPMTAGQWVIRFILAALLYVVIYFTFGYFIAWQNAAVRSYYGGGNLTGFAEQVQATWQATPWLFPFQFVRGLIWTALAVPIIKMIKGSGWERALVVALVFGVVMNTQLLLPNPLMPYEVRMAHLLETASSNFLFGCLVGWLLNRQHVQVAN